jgi:predicted phage terminase large subunit-like protein
VSSKLSLTPRERARAAAIASELKRRQGTPGLDRWLREVSSHFNWDWAHIQYVRQHLDKVTSGEIKRLIIEMPPRHGKSELATIRYPVYRLKQRPETRIIVGAYSQTLAEKFSRKARRIAANGQLDLSKERNSAEDWETVQGGGFRAVGVGGGVTGQGGDLIVVDDPVKNREEAESLVYRDKVWDWFTNDLYTRLEPGGAIIVIMTRWHKDDLVGRILESETGGQWTRLRLPAEAEPGDPIGRSEGQALCPDRFPLSVLADIHKVLGRDYHALYQQRPQPREGGMFKDHWFKRVEAVPAEARRVRWWDMAATPDGGDWTVGLLMAEHQGIYTLEDVVRGQWSSGERDKVIRQTAANDAEKYGAGAVAIWGGQEPGSAGKDAAGNFIKMLAGYTVRTEPETGPKEVRAQPLAAQAEAGNVAVLKAPWTATLIDEFCDFPSGKNDDQVDSGSHAFNKLALGLTVSAVPNTLFD